MSSTEWSSAFNHDLSSAMWAVIGVPFRQQTYRNLSYLALAFPLGLLYFVLFAVGISLGVGLTVVVIGIPLLIGMLALATGFARAERWLATVLLGIKVPTGNLETPDSVRGWIRRLVTSLGPWKAVLYLPTKLFIGVVAYVIVMSVSVTGMSMLAVPLVYNQSGVYVGIVSDAPVSYHPALYVGWDQLLVGLDGVVTLSAWRINTLAEAVVVAGIGVGIVLFSLHLLNALARLSGWWTQLLLGTRENDTRARV